VATQPTAWQWWLANPPLGSGGYVKSVLSIFNDQAIAATAFTAFRKKAQFVGKGCEVASPVHDDSKSGQKAARMQNFAISRQPTE